MGINLCKKSGNNLYNNDALSDQIQLGDLLSESLHEETAKANVPSINYHQMYYSNQPENKIKVFFNYHIGCK